MSRALYQGTWRVAVQVYVSGSKSRNR